MSSLINHQVREFSVRIFTNLLLISIMLVTFICLQLIFISTVKTALLIVEHTFQQLISHLVTDSI